MWQEDETSEPLFPDDDGSDERSLGDSRLSQEDSGKRPKSPQPGQFPANFIPSTALPNVVPVMDIYEAARIRAVAEQQLSKLFNPEYYI